MGRGGSLIVSAGLAATTTMLGLAGTAASAKGPNGLLTSLRPSSSTAQLPRTTAAPRAVAPTSNSGAEHILLVYGDNAAPAALRTQLLAQPGVLTVDTFNAATGTPTLAQLQQYDIVYAYSNAPYAAGATLGDRLADYEDGGGVVIAGFGSFYGGNYSIEGRWHSGGYSPYTYNMAILLTPVTLGVHDSTHPLLQGVSTLSAVARINNSLAAGAYQVAAYSDTTAAVAFKTTNGHTAVGMPAYLGDAGNFGTGDYAKVIVNAGRWLVPTLTATKAGSGSGTVTSSPAGIDCGSSCAHAFAYGTSVTLTATPAPGTGSTFAGWSGAGCSGTGTCVVAMNADKTAIATFTAPRRLTVTKSGSGSGGVTSSPGGIDCGVTCSVLFTDGTSVTLTATAAAGSVFTGWSGACSGTSTCPLAMTADRDATATFQASCIVPKVKGKTLAAAKTAIKARHCSVGSVKKSFSSKVKKGRVISQAPAAGKTLAPGAKVNLTVSKGKKT
jgi:hypothetical protein